ncbi:MULTISPECIES: hypothetical protein [unclassified Sphingomonas]|uniref:hypothetical protein n=1 Tax=unclassified Sphingomonas TaxID=196159 RepID=UPI00226AE93D|nr:MULTISPECIES: hypothetical protein [unclassified Sphingomonas]
MPLTHMGVIALRIVATAFALWNVRWAASGALELMRGKLRPPEIYLAVVFWMSVAVLVFQASYIVGQTDGWRLFAYTILTTTMALGSLGHVLGAPYEARQFYATWDHLGVATAMVDLARVNPQAAERIAEECRHLTAAQLVTKHG